MTIHNAMRHLTKAAFTALLLGVVAVLGQIPMGEPSQSSTVRLALRTVHGKVEVCKDRTQAELDALPIHMRQARTCEAFTPSYRLQVMVDREPVLDREVAPGGARGDRPLTVDEQITLDPGSRQIEVLFSPVVPEGLDAESLAGLLELPQFRLDERVELVPDRITLVLLDESRERLEVYGSGSGPAG